MADAPGAASTPSIPPVHELIDEPTRAFIRGAIAENRGDEVFFVARTDEAGVVREARVAARGHRTAAPAIVAAAAGWHCAIHNHPSGRLAPSDADLDVASALGNGGIAFYIVDNDVAACLPVVPVAPPRPSAPLDAAEIDALIGPDGPLAARIEGYEARPEQRAMAAAVARAFSSGKVLLVEAGTGTGKSLAYLVPAVLWAVRRREKVIASTATINLQEQLVAKDIPVLAGEGLPPFRSALVKGRGNYVSLRRAEEARAGQAELFEEDGDRASLGAVTRWLKTTRTGDRAELPHPPADAVWDRVESTPDSCLRTRCPTYGKCFYFRTRQEAGRADLLVANHHLLFSDLSIKAELGDFDAPAVLPAFRHLVIDEAHHIEDTASDYFGTRVTALGLRRLLGRLVSRRRLGRGIIPALVERAIKSRHPDAARAARILEEEALPAHGSAALAAEEDLAAIRDHVAAHVADAGGATEAVAEGAGAGRPRDRKVRLRSAKAGETLWTVLRPPLDRTRQRLGTLGAVVVRAAKALEDVDEPRVRDELAGAALELRSAARRCQSAARSIELFLDDRDESHVRWVELRARRGRSRPGETAEDRVLANLHVAPLRVDEVLREKLFDHVHGAVLSSATLAVAGSFEYVRRRLGLADLPEGRVEEMILGSPFDYARRCAVGVTTGIPEPGDPLYEPRVIIATREAVKRSGGRAFVLFTSYGMLRRVHQALAPILEREGLLVLRQGDGNRTALLDRFRKAGNAVLFGTDSFWEGVDVKGDALSLVVITRLPFRVPDEPLWQARAEDLQRRGGDPFRQMTVPAAVLKFRQGVGRLIRSKSDRGAILILDRRVVTRGYGQAFLESLPAGVPVTTGTVPEVLRAIGRVLPD